MSKIDSAVRVRAAAMSSDGRHFQFAGTSESLFEPGVLVLLHAPDEAPRLGQVEEVSYTMGGAPQGSGRILGLVGDDGRLDVRKSVAFASAVLEPADARTAEILYGNAAVTLPIGSFLASDDIPARLFAHRFNRHTFWCGQSGSGKTYALGVLLEQLLIHTTLPLVIFDPNADFVQIRQPHPTGESSDAQRVLAERNIRILRPTAAVPDTLRVKFLDLSLRAKAAVFSLDRLDDRAEHNELMHSKTPWAWRIFRTWPPGCGNGAHRRRTTWPHAPRICG